MNDASILLLYKNRNGFFVYDWFWDREELIEYIKQEDILEDYINEIIEIRDCYNITDSIIAELRGN